MALIEISASDIDTAGLSIDVVLPPAWIAEQLEEVSATSAEPGHVEARLSMSSNEVVVRGRVKAIVTLSCARCLDPAVVNVDTELSLLLQPVASAVPTRGTPVRRPRGVKAPVAVAEGASVSKNPRVAKASRGAEAAAPGKSVGAKSKAKSKKDVEYEFSSDEADTDTYDGENVVLDPFVREAILLEMPIFPLCSEDCPGIGPPAEAVEPTSAPPEIDPRLAPLGALRAKLSQNQGSAKKHAPDSSASPPLASKTSKKPKKE